MSSDGRQRIAALRRLHDDLVMFVDGLDNDALDTPSGSAEWSVAQVLSHLGSGAEIGRNTLLASIEGAPVPGPEALQSIWDRWNAMSSTEMARQFQESDELLVSEFEGLSDDAVENLRVDLGFLPEPIDVATTVTFRLNEHGLHSWDVFVAFDHEATLAPYVVPFLAEQMVRMIGFTSKPLGTATDILIETTAPEQHYMLELRDAVTLRPSTDGETDAGTTLRLPLEALLRLAAGRLGRHHTPPTVAVEGELTLDDMRAVFPGY